ncbi:uncharacterized protein J3R85_001416 [Psidium guajava]|nr:uncharacterized protein J3R85_001416 [Psidium guajava]
MGSLSLADSSLLFLKPRNDAAEQANPRFTETGTYCEEIAHNASTRKRKEIAKRAAQLDVEVPNKLARLRSQEDE